MRLASFKSSFFSTRSPKGAKSYASFLRPSLRTSMALLLAGATMNSALANEQFASCTAALAGKAKQEGVSQQTIDDVFPRLVHQDRVIELDRSQPEFVQTFPGYFSKRVTDWRTEKGKEMYAKHDKLLHKLSEKYGVPPHYLLAFWGLETNFGSYKGKMPVLDSLATLACDKRRSTYFTQEFLVAVKLMEREKLQKEDMIGSWAGAMGHTQFMPSSFQQYAEDFTGDGKRDIWSDDPRDALASTAAYLKHFGWVQGQPWGVEVRLPEGFDYLLAGRDILKTAAEWRALGVRPVTGSLGDHGPASLLLPAGAEGAAFLIYANFAVIERYNSADAYVIGVGHLADRIAGGGPIEASWPVQDRALTYDERIELQTQLTAQGFDTVQIDAKIGPLTINAVREFQLSQGLVPDGYASPRLLEALRAAAAE